MTTRTLVLLGPHGAGKTTLGRHLSRVLGWPFDEEIGKRLRLERLGRNPHAHAMAPQPDFDRQVFEEELARDWLRQATGGCRIVETWHPGNVAYARRRSPDVVARYLPRLERAAREAPGVLVVPVAIGRATLEARMSEPGPAGMLEHLAAVAREAESLARQWGLAVAPAVWNEHRRIDATVTDVLETLGNRRKHEEG